MGAGILPAAVYKNQVYFLFGKENEFEESAPGFSDFGGGSEQNENLFNTAIREASEELSGFFGSKEDIKKLLKKHGTYNIDLNQNNSSSTYRMFIFPYQYDDKLPFYFNNNRKFLRTNLDENVIKNTTIFEKEEIRWIALKDLKKKRSEFRHYFRNIIDKICDEKDNIQKFIFKKLTKKKNTLKNKKIT